MTEIIAKRGTGDLDGPDILEPLADSLAALQERGRGELDEGEESRVVEISGRHWGMLRAGQLVRAVDIDYGPVFVGRVTAIEHIDLGAGVETYTTLDVPTAGVDPAQNPPAVVVDNGDGTAQL